MRGEGSRLLKLAALLRLRGNAASASMCYMYIWSFSANQRSVRCLSVCGGIVFNESVVGSYPVHTKSLDCHMLVISTIPRSTNKT